MKNIKFSKSIIIALSLLLVASLSGCTFGRQTEEIKTTITEVGITTQIKGDNSPISGFSNVIAATSPVIYLSGKINNAVKGVRLSIVWKHGNTTIATESLNGKRDGRRPYDFVTSSTPKTSYFSSRIGLTGITWQVGDYKAIVEYNGQVVKTINFEIVSGQDFEQSDKEQLIKSFYLGEEINTSNQITIPSKKFSRDQENIYAVALFKDVPAGSTLKATWWHIDGNQKITDFMQRFSGSGYVPFKISLDDFSRLWSDGIWPIGQYRVDIYVDNTRIATENFVVS